MHHPGDVVAGFRIERLLGSGGMGEVYLVHHPRLPRLDALKLLPTATSADHSYRERFQREADLAARLDHDSVVTVYDRGEADGQLWIHMKYVAGQDAAAALRKDGPFTAARALHTITRVAAALDAAHRHGLLHRDVKPANILLGTPAEPGEPERVFLTDFGIAKGVGDAAELTPSGHFAASLDYASPEQIQVQPLDGRSDQYALGCVLFQLLTGSVPYPGDGPWARMNAHLTAAVPQVGQLRPGLPLGVQAVLDRALAKDPKERFETCGAMAAALSVALKEHQRGSTEGAVISLPEPATERFLATAGVSSHPRETVLPGPRPPDRSETPQPMPAAAVSTPWPASFPPPAATAQAPVPPPVPPKNPADVWWRKVDRGAGGVLIGALALTVLTELPPSSSRIESTFPAEVGTGRFVAGLLPVLLLVLVAGALQLTRHGHRWRPLLSAVLVGTGTFVAVDSTRVYAFAHANPGGAYNSVDEVSGALPRAILGLVIGLIALTGVLRPPPRPKPRPAPHALIALLLAAVAVVLATIAVIIGPVIQRPRLHQVIYGVPLASALAAAALLGLAVWTRRVPLIVAGAVVAGCAGLGALGAPDPLHYPMGILADACLLAAATVLLLAARRPISPPPPPSPPGPYQRVNWPPPNGYRP
ncbi:MAG: serine/threonine protein kinase [Mycobacterium sp.]|nr:serine/threonine protein kinase [Mycobacterium sp.]